MLRLSTLFTADSLEASHAEPFLRPSCTRETAEEQLALDEVVRRHIGRVLESTHRNKTQAARLLGIPLTTLVNKMKRLGLA